MGRPSEPTSTVEGPPRQNASTHAPACRRPHLSPPISSPPSQRIEPAGFLEANPNPRSAPEGPLPSGLVPLRRGLRTPEPQRWTHPAARPPPEPLGALLVIHGGRQAGPSEPPANFKGPLRQNAWAHAPARQRPPLGPPLCLRHIRRMGPAASWVLTLTLVRPLRGPSQGAWRHNTGDWGPPSPSDGLTLPPCHPATTLPPPALPVIQGGRRAGPSEPPAIFEAPTPKRLGLRSRLAVLSPRPTTTLAAEPAYRACRLPGG